MEDLRKRLAQNGAFDLFPAKGQPQQRRARDTDSPSGTVITISSAESSPASSGSTKATSKSSGGSKQAVIEIESDGSLADLAAGQESDSSDVKTKPAKTRLVWISDDEDDAQTSKPVKQAYATKLVPTTVPERTVSVFTKPPSTIRLPTTPRERSQLKSSDGPLWESFDVTTEDNLYDPKKSAVDAERDLQDLLSQSMNETVDELDMRNAVVPGFTDEIRLLPHQVVGRKWMEERETGKKAGGILADDMGLGKTIQTLTRIVDGRPRKSDKENGYAASTLVVCPVGLVSQWASEIKKMAVGLRVIEHHGPNRSKDPETLRRAHVVITSYSVLSSEHASFEQQLSEKTQDKSKSKSKSRGSSSDEDSGDDDLDDDSDFRGGKFGKTVSKKMAAKPKKIMDALFHLKWWRIVLDEAHNIKNRKTKAALACCALEGKFRWCLTGTPMQNNVEELYSLLKFLRIRPLNDWDTFNNQINKPVKSGRSQRAMKRLQVVLKAIMLRRKKDALLHGKPIIELPDRIVKVVDCLFDHDEREFYDAIANKVELTLNKFTKNGTAMMNYTSMLVLLLRLRQACNHPSLVSKDFAVDKEAVEPCAAKDGKDIDDGDDLADLFGQMGVSAIRKCSLCQSPLTAGVTTNYCSDCESLASRARRKSLAPSSSSLPPDSAKIRMIVQLLREIKDRSAGQEKTIIFSQFTTMLDLIQPFLRAEGIQFVRYDGSMRKEQREESLEKIRNDKFTKCILISFKAGSTGLNLTACNNVILVDLWWNPALEDQAFDRAHRLGQTRQVNIFKLTIEQTVETRILELQEKKRELAAAALSGDKLKNSRLGLDDLMALFKPGARGDEDD